MSLKRAELYTLIQEMQPLLRGGVVQDFFEIAPRTFVLHLIKSSQPLKVLLCLQEPFLRIHLWTGKAKGHECVWSKYIQSKVIHEIQMLHGDRIAQISFNDHTALIAELFPKRPNLFLVNAKGHILLALNRVEHEVYAAPVNALAQEVLEIVPNISSASIQAFYASKEEQAAFQKGKLSLHHQVNLRLKRVRRELDRAQKNLENSQHWDTIQHEGQLLQANLYKMHKGMSEILVEDWTEEGSLRKIVLDPKLDPKNEVAKRFKMSKKLKTGLEYIERWCHEIELEKHRWENALQHVEAADSWESLQMLMPLVETSKPKPEPALPYHEFTTAAGLKIWVGKNAQNNEKLTFSCAKGSDWWFHVADFPGSHVVLRVQKNQEPDAESIQDALQVALAYSKAKGQGAADITVTQCKYVSRLGRGKTGKVQLSKHQTMTAQFDAKRFDRLKGV